MFCSQLARANDSAANSANAATKLPAKPSKGHATPDLPVTPLLQVQATKQQDRATKGTQAVTLSIDHSQFVLLASMSYATFRSLLEWDETSSAPSRAGMVVKRICLKALVKLPY